MIERSYYKIAKKGMLKAYLQPRYILILAMKILTRPWLGRMLEMTFVTAIKVRQGSEMDFDPTRSSCKGRKGNALALRADEGRDKLR